MVQSVHMKKLILLSLLLLQACTAFVPKPIESLSIALSPTISVEVFNEHKKDFEIALKAQLREEGYDVQKLELVRATSNRQAGEMVISGVADIAFISKLTYFDLNDQGLMPMLTLLEPAYNLDASSLEAWNDPIQLEASKSLKSSHRSALYLGSSTKAMTLRDKLNAGDQLTWIDLNSVKWCHVLVTSLEGYIYPSLWLIENYDRRIVELFQHERVVRGYDELMMRAANQDCDVIVGPENLRELYLNQWSSEGYDRDASIYAELEIFALTESIPHDVVVYMEAQTKYDAVFVQILQKVLIDLSSLEIKNPLFEQMQIKGLIETSPEDFDNYTKAYDYLQEIFN